MRTYENFIPAVSEEKLQPLNFPECVYLTEHYRCGILRIKACSGKACSFCQSRRKHSESERAWSSRMNRLSEEKQTQIAAAYYGGKMPWKKQIGEV